MNTASAIIGSDPMETHTIMNSGQCRSSGSRNRLAGFFSFCGRKWCTSNFRGVIMLANPHTVRSRDRL